MPQTPKSLLGNKISRICNCVWNSSLYFSSHNALIADLSYIIFFKLTFLNQVYSVKTFNDTLPHNHLFLTLHMLFSVIWLIKKANYFKVIQTVTSSIHLLGLKKIIAPTVFPQHIQSTCHAAGDRASWKSISNKDAGGVHALSSTKPSYQPFLKKLRILMRLIKRSVIFCTFSLKYRNTFMISFKQHFTNLIICLFKRELYKHLKL